MLVVLVAAVALVAAVLHWQSVRGRRQHLERVMTYHHTAEAEHRLQSVQAGEPSRTAGSAEAGGGVPVDGRAEPDDSADQPANSGDEELWFLAIRAKELFDRGDFRGAAEYASMALEHDPDDTAADETLHKAVFNNGLELLRAGEYVKAVAWFDRWHSSNAADIETARLKDLAHRLAAEAPAGPPADAGGSGRLAEELSGWDLRR